MDALAVKERETIGNPEVPVLKAVLASVRRQVGGIGREYVQKESMVAACQQRRAIRVEVAQFAVVDIDVNIRARERIAVCHNIVIHGAVVVAVGV